MKVWTPIYNFISIFIMIIFVSTYIHESRIIERDFDQERLNYAVGQATNAMFMATLETEHLDMDYQDMAYAVINSSNSLDIFDRVMCFNYDMAPSQFNFDMINNSIEACVLAGYDGFYIADNYEADLIPDNGYTVDGWQMRFSPKIPYFVYNPSNPNMAYSINAYKQTYIGANNSNYADSPIMYIEGQALPPGVLESDLKLAINTQIRRAVLDVLKNTNNKSLNDLNNFRLYFPEDPTVTGVNPFDVPGIVIILGQAEWASKYHISAMSVSGYKVIRKVSVVAFIDERTHRAYYCYDSQLRDEEKVKDSGGVPSDGKYGNFRIVNYYNTIQEACKAPAAEKGPNGELQHYAPYYDIISRKITKYD